MPSYGSNPRPDGCSILDHHASMWMDVPVRHGVVLALGVRLHAVSGVIRHMWQSCASSSHGWESHP
jgi:hypothetical protein